MVGRRWFRFRLRSLLLAIVVFGVLGAFAKRAKDLNDKADRHDDVGFSFAQMATEVNQSGITSERAQALAMYHRNTADAYRRAIYRPWVTVHESPQPEDAVLGGGVR